VKNIWQGEEEEKVLPGEAEVLQLKKPGGQEKGNTVRVEREEKEGNDSYSFSSHDVRGLVGGINI